MHQQQQQSPARPLRPQTASPLRGTPIAGSFAIGSGNGIGSPFRADASAAASPTAPSPLRPKTAAVARRGTSPSPAAAPFGGPSAAWVQSASLVERAAQRPTGGVSGAPTRFTPSLSVRVSSPASSPSRPSSRPASAGWGGSSARPVAVGAGGVGGGASASSAPPPASFTPYTPQVPFNSFTPFTGPYAYLAHNVPTQASSNAHIDWLRLEVLKRDIRVMSRAIRDGLDFQAGVDARRRIDDRATPPTPPPVHAPLPVPLVSQLGGLALTQTLTARTQSSDEEKDSSGNDALIGREAVVPLETWESLVSRALQRFGHSSDYLQSLTSTVGLLEVWCVQSSRMVDTAAWMTDHALTRCGAFQTFAKREADRKNGGGGDANGSADADDDTNEQIFSFRATLAALLPMMAPLSNEDAGAAGDESRRRLGDSASTGSLALASGVGGGSGALAESSLFHALPALAALLERLSLLTRFASWADGSLSRARQEASARRKEHRAMVAEMSLLATAVREAAEDRPKTKRVIHEHVHVVRNATPTDTTNGGEYGNATHARKASDQARTPSRPQSAVASRPLRPASPAAPVAAVTPSSVDPSPAATSSESDAATIASLQHEVWLLRQSLEEERRARRSIAADEAERVRSEVAALESAARTAAADRDTAQRECESARASLETRTQSFEVALKRLQVELQSAESNAAEKTRTELAAAHAAEWTERLKAERAHRDRVERERWEVHVKAMAELKTNWGVTVAELATAREELDLLRRRQLASRTDAEARRVALIDRQDAAERDRADAAAAAEREAKSRRAFESDLAARRKALEKEMRVTRDAAAAETSAAMESARVAEEELNRSRREKSHLEETLEAALRREAQRAHEWLEHVATTKALKHDLHACEEARTELQTRLENETAAFEVADAKTRGTLAALEAEVTDLRKRGQESEAVGADACARLLAAQEEATARDADLRDSHANLSGAREQVVRLEAELDAARDALREAAHRAHRNEHSTVADLTAAKKQVGEQQGVIRGLEERLAEVQQQVTQMQQQQQQAAAAAAAAASLPPTPSGASPMNLQSPTRASTSSLLPSPSGSGLRAATRPSTPKQAAREDASRRDLDFQWVTLRQAQATLATSEANANRTAAVLAQQRADLAEEQRMLAASAALLHSDLLIRLGAIRQVDAATIASVAATSPAASPSSTLTLARVDSLHASVSSHASNARVIQLHLEREARDPPTRPHADTLAERLEALRRACEYHEGRLADDTPEKSASDAIDPADPNAAPTPKRVLFGPGS